MPAPLLSSKAAGPQPRRSVALRQPCRISRLRRQPPAMVVTTRPPHWLRRRCARSLVGRRDDVFLLMGGVLLRHRLPLLSRITTTMSLCFSYRHVTHGALASCTTICSLLSCVKRRRCHAATGGDGDACGGLRTGVCAGQPPEGKGGDSARALCIYRMECVVLPHSPACRTHRWRCDGPRHRC